MMTHEDYVRMLRWIEKADQWYSDESGRADNVTFNVEVDMLRRVVSLYEKILDCFDLMRAEGVSEKVEEILSKMENLLRNV